jgi:glucose/arabinose dehydrogenase
MKVIFTSSTVPGVYHDGGHIRFGPDGMLYAVVGEAHNPANAQNLNVSGGKVLRMTPTGGVPGTNPFAGRRIWSFGLRNSFGFTFDPRTGHLWETENGPECNDELNRIVKGGNFGWGPNENCSGTSPNDTNNSGRTPRILPKRWYTPTIAPTGVAFCQKCGLGAKNNGKLFFGTYNTDNIRRVTLTANRLGVAGQAIVYNHGSSILSMEVGPNHAIYFSDAGGIYRLVLG